MEAVWRCGYQIRGVAVLWKQCGEIRYIVRSDTKCGSELTQWSRRNFGNVRRELKEKRKLLVKAEHVVAHTGNNYRVRELNKEVTKLMIKEKKM